MTETPFGRKVKARLIRAMVQIPLLRRWLNARYLTFTPAQRAVYHWRYSKLFRGWIPRQLQPGAWKVEFASKPIFMPLRAEMMWLDWDTAVSIVGHDVEIKETYAWLVSSEHKPDLFLDIGANYGTHSLLFATHGIPVVSFEPNPSCFDYHEVACKLNGLKPNWEFLALGSGEGTIDLVFPEQDTWHGSTSPETIAAVKAWGPVRTLAVKVATLDGYVHRNAHLADKRRTLMKIDVEGSEIDVLLGAQQTIRRLTPVIIFESNSPNTRPGLAKFMEEIGYNICILPWRHDSASQPLRYAEFMNSPMTNFIAVPSERKVG
jgi:FkbM family methyltransferase